MKRFFSSLLICIAMLIGVASTVSAQTEPYTPRWRNERVYPKNFNTWYMHIGYHGSDSTGCPAPYHTYADVENQACRILNWDAVPNAEGVYYADIRIQPFTSSDYIVRWPWKWYSAATGATYYFLSRTP